ncbi:hypothetical protein MBLNU459_g4778t2 [Dothideomycetes sp. NU459]
MATSDAVQGSIKDLEIRLLAKPGSSIIQVVVHNDSPTYTYSLLTWDTPIDPKAINTGILTLENSETDLQPNNLLMGIHDNSALDKFAERAADSPMPRKELSDRVIYVSQPMPLTKGNPSISDLSEARFGQSKYTGLIIPNVYRAPEVILGMDWNYPADIWGFGMTLWDLFQPERLFSARGEDGQYSECHHLAQMVAILGNPPLDFLRTSEKCLQYWDLDGKWTHEVAIPEITLENCEKRLLGEDKEQFLTFMRKMLQWKPEDRSDCQDVFFDEWLLADLIESGEIVRDD